MKYFLTVLISVMLAVSGFAYDGVDNAEDENKKDAPEVFCPVTKFTDNEKCMTCHQMITEDGKPKFGLKEIDPAANYAQKPFSLNIIHETVDGPPVGYVEINGTGAVKFRQIADYLLWHPEIKRLIIELHTGGGSIMEAWRSVGAIKEMQAVGVEVETRVNGMAASAGVILLVAGDKRLVNPNAEIMIHKIWTFTMFDIKTPDSSQDQADVLKHFQDNINAFLRERTKLTEEQLDSKIFKKNWWMTGRQAVKLGIATGLIGE